MGTALGKVVSGFIDGMVMPAVGMISGVDFSKSVITLKDAVTDATGKVTVEAITIKYGAFVSSFIDFLLIALVVFIVIKALNKMKKNKAEAAPVAPSSTDALLMEIRDALKK